MRVVQQQVHDCQLSDNSGLRHGTLVVSSCFPEPAVAAFARVTGFHSLPKATDTFMRESVPMSKKRASSVRPPPVVRPPPSDGRPKNSLLAALPADDFRRLLPFLTTVPICARQVLHKNGEPLRAVYFINGGVASITTVLPDG